MRPLDFTLLAILLLLSWQNRGFAQTPATPASSNSPASAALLDSCLTSLTRPQGVDVRFRMTLNTRSEPAEISGQSITAEKNRVKIELKYQQVQRTGQLKLLCDGNTFYRLDSVHNHNTYVTYTLKELQDALDKLVTNETERVAKEDVEKEQRGIHGFDGIAAMVKDLKTRMAFADPTSAKIDLGDKKQLSVKMVEGRWTSEMLENIAPTKKGSDPNQQDQRYLWNDKLYFFFVPRMARFYFDEKSQQLLRLELLGITEKHGPDKVLSTVDILSLTPLSSVDNTWFTPTAEELRYEKVDIDLVGLIKASHQQTLNILKMQQQMQK